MLAMMVGAIGFHVAYVSFFSADRALKAFESNSENYIYNWEGWVKDGSLKCQSKPTLETCTLFTETIDPATSESSKRLRIIACSAYECQWVL